MLKTKIAFFVSFLQTMIVIMIVIIATITHIYN